MLNRYVGIRTKGDRLLELLGLTAGGHGMVK
jgi:hypothetical protein